MVRENVSEVLVRTYGMVEVSTGDGLVPTLPCSKQGKLEQASQDHIQFWFEYLQDWRLYNLCGQSVPVFDPVCNKNGGLSLGFF